MELEIDSKNLEEFLEGGKPMIIDFWAEWCGPCRSIAPIISELAEEYEGKINVGKCDVENSNDLAVKYGVRNIPTILFFKDGQLVDKVVGATQKAVLVEKINSLL